MEQTMENVIEETTKEVQETKTIEERMLEALEVSRSYLFDISYSISHIEKDVASLGYKIERIKDEVESLKGDSYPKANLADIQKELNEIRGQYSPRSLKEIYDRVDALYHKR